MLLCFHLQSSSKMKESEHKKSTHKIILNFNKTKKEKEIKKKHRTVSAGEWLEMAKMIATLQYLRFKAKLRTTACSLHTWLLCFLHIERFSCSLILYRNVRRLSRDKCCVHSGGCCWFSLYFFRASWRVRLSLYRAERRVNNNNGVAVNLIRWEND